MPVVDNVQNGISSAQSFSNQPEQAMSYGEFLKSQGLDPGIYQSNFFKFIGGNMFGDYTRHENDYQAYLQNLNKLNEEKAIANARAYDLWLDSTRYQRAADDLRKAGLNPWLALNSGFGTSAIGTMANSSAKGVEYEFQNNSKSALAGLLGALAKLLAA